MSHIESLNRSYIYRLLDRQVCVTAKLQPLTSFSCCRYEGDFLHGKMEGLGTFTWSSGYAYSGLWMVSCANAFAVHTLSLYLLGAIDLSTSPLSPLISHWVALCLLLGWPAPWRGLNAPSRWHSCLDFQLELWSARAARESLLQPRWFAADCGLTFREK